MTASGRTVMTRKGQITVPAAIRNAMGLKEGDLVELEYDEERCEVRLRPAESVVDRLYGALKGRFPYMTAEEMRRIAAEEMGRNAAQEGL